MGNETKWADVSHYYKYVEHEVLISHSRNRDPLKRISKEGEDLSVYYRRPDLVEAGFITVPTLRHRDDMTEADARELWEIQIGEAWVQDTDETAIQCLFFNIGNSQMEMADNATFLSVLVGEPKAWNYLISRGFDVFGLIESGQAIRKEVGNGL